MEVPLNVFLFRLAVLVLAYLNYAHATSPITVQVGIISELSDDNRLYDPKFWSSSNDYTTAVSIVPLSAKVPWWDTLQVRRAACSLFSQGVDGVLSFLPPNLSPMLSSYAQTYGLPLIIAKNPQAMTLNSEVQMIPNTEKTASDLMTSYKWKSFAFMYDSDDGPVLLQKIMDRNPQIEVEAVWRVSNGEQAARFLQLLENNAEYQQKKEIQNVLFATDNALLDEALISMPMLFLGKLKFHFISANPVLRLQKYFPVWHLVTRLCLVDSNATAYRNLENRWRTLLQPYRRVTEPSTNDVPESAMLASDAIRLLSKTYNDFAQHNGIFGQQDTEGYAVQIQCSQNPSKTPVTRSGKGSSVSQHLKEIDFHNGVTGTVKFEQSGERLDFTLHVFETTSSVTKKVGEWSDYGGLKMAGDTTATTELNDDPFERNKKDGKSGKPIIVTSVLVAPFLMRKQSLNLQGNDRFEGFVIDLMDQVSSMLNVNYELKVVKDGKFGFYNGTHWNGMIGEVMREDADVAVAPLTVTRSREEVVDFTTPFMTLGMNILMKRPAALDGKATSKLTPFGFLHAFTYEIWLVLIAVYVFFGVGFFAVSRFTGAPDRIRSVDTKGSDHLSVCSSFWFAAGSLFLQNTGIYPRSISHRVLSVVWWIFTLITLVAYIGSLSSMMIKERTTIHGRVDNYLTSFELLKNFIETGTPTIGVVGSGSSEAFFKYSQVGVFHQYGQFLKENRDAVTNSYSEGIERVRNSNGSYAFIIESASAEFVSNHPPCDTVTTFGYLDTRSYSMAIKKGSYLGESLDQALLDILESGALRQIYEKWWHQDTECSNPTLDVLPGLYDSSLKITEVSGAFYILTIGVVVASLTALAEYFIRSKKLTVDK